jgi:hypothetical protein
LDNNQYGWANPSPPVDFRKLYCQVSDAFCGRKLNKLIEKNVHEGERKREKKNSIVVSREKKFCEKKSCGARGKITSSRLEKPFFFFL